MSKKPRELKKFKITSITVDNTFGFEVGDEFTIESEFVPTRWERIKGWINRKFYPVKWPLLRVKWYFQSIWDAICGRTA